MYFEGRIEQCRESCLELLSRPYLPRYLRVDTLQVLAATSPLATAKEYLEKALLVLDECDQIDTQKTTDILRAETKRLIAYREEEARSAQIQEGSSAEEAESSENGNENSEDEERGSEEEDEGTGEGEDETAGATTSAVDDENNGSVATGSQHQVRYFKYGGYLGLLFY